MGTRVRTACLALTTIVAATGCNKAGRDHATQVFADGIGESLDVSQREWIRREHAREIGPVIVASVVASAAGPGGCPPLVALNTEAGWRTVLFSDWSLKSPTPSVFEPPDPRVDIR